MRLKSATLHGLWGVYSPSGKKEINIDFTKCKHNIVLIVGKNGSGKTTIWEALQPIPLSPTYFMDGEPGFVHLEYFHNDIVYKIRIEYPITNSRARGVTKAFITKVLDDEEIELNPNGNINSYKSILYNEFALDPSFVSLSQISQEDMGIVNKRPSDRKKYVSSITDNIEVYNNIYKSLVKRSGIFKSMINSITAKIDTIGNRENLQTNLNAIEVRVDRLTKERDEILKSLAKLESMVAVTDPDGKIQERFRTLSREISIIEDELKVDATIIETINRTCNTTDIEDIMKSIISITSAQTKYERERERYHITLQNIESEKSQLMSKYQMINSKLIALKSEFNIEVIKQQISSITQSIGECELVFARLGFDKNTSVTKDEFITGVNIISNIKDSVEVIKSIANDEYVLSSAIDCCKSGNSTAPVASEFLTKKKETEELLINAREEYRSMKLLVDQMDALNNRPSDCTIDTCPYIAKAVEAAKQDPENKMKKLESLISNLESSLERIQNECDINNHIAELENRIQVVLRFIQTNKSILDKFPTGNQLTDSSVFLSNFTSVTFFNKLTDLSQSLYCANTFEQYKALQDRLKSLNADYKVYKEKDNTILELNSELEQIKQDIINLDEKITGTKSHIELSDEHINQCISNISTRESYVDILKKRKSKEERLKDLNIQMDTMSANILVIDQAISEINALNSKLYSIDLDLKPINNEKDQLKYSIKQLDEYITELEIYNEKYQKIEIIKKYSSPTKGGIQTLFMQLYMGKTISMANELLSTLFDGRMELEPYIINDTEFRIPCINKESNVHHDDISSCSSAEKAMISMMIGFSLLFHSSTVYNILRLDEIDGALDQDNRSNFINLLNSFMGKFGIEQCVMISHSSELDMGEVDVIQLVPVAGSSDTNGNVIFTY